MEEQSVLMAISLLLHGHRFTGTIDKVTYKLGPSQMTAEEQKAGAEAVKKATD